MSARVFTGAYVARPKSWPERWAYLVSEARRILASPNAHTVTEVRWAEDVLTVEGGAYWPAVMKSADTAL
jgi:hypothetical protein